MILIYTKPGDEHADAVEARLRARGASVMRLDAARFPAHATLALEHDGARPTLSVDLGAGAIALDGVETVWWRRPATPEPAAALRDPLVRDLVRDDTDAALRDLLAALGAHFVPAPPATLAAARPRFRQLCLARHLGLAIPPTLVTNDPERALAFYQAHDGNVVSKLAGHQLVRGPLALELCRYTEKVQRADLAHLGALRLCPMVLQGYVEKRLELRVTVVGEQLFAVEIDSQRRRRTRLDWRRYDLARTPHRPHTLPATVERACLGLVRRLGLVYGAIDLVLTPDGEYVFLEINPNGQYLWLEELTGLPITDALCDLLLRRAREGAA
jgi:glutathione synthase/RimK-type ligase-like ATP-grasp enzyme